MTGHVVSEGDVLTVPVEARPRQGREAGLFTRLAASVIDGVIVVLLLFVGYASVNIAVFMLDPRKFRFLDSSAVFLLGAGIVLAIVYLTVGWALTGRSYGCHVMGLRLVDRRRRNPRPLLALVRACFCVLFPVGLVWCAISRGRSSVQDVVLRTCVVYDWRLRHESPERSQA